jgi:hypothetical protein
MATAVFSYKISPLLIFLATQNRTNVISSSLGATTPSEPGPLHYRRFTISLRYTTLGRAPLDQWSARRRYLYLTTHTRQTSVPPNGFEPAIPASERPQTHALERAATGIGNQSYSKRNYTVYNLHTWTWCIGIVRALFQLIVRGTLSNANDYARHAYCMSYCVIIWRLRSCCGFLRSIGMFLLI